MKIIGSGMCEENGKKVFEVVDVKRPPDRVSANRVGGVRQM